MCVEKTDGAALFGKTKISLPHALPRAVVATHIMAHIYCAKTPHFNTGRIDPSLKLEGSLDQSEPRVSSTVYLIKYE